MLCAPTVGCAMGLGGSVEVNAGLVSARVTTAEADTSERTWATTAGASFNVEFDENRDANLAAGFGPQRILPWRGDRIVAATPATFAYAASLEDAGWKVRPRGYFGFAFERSEAAYFAAYLAVGASLHPAQGVAVHVALGPQFVFGESRTYGAPEVAYTGHGGQLRVRLFRMLATDCDPRSAVGPKRRHPC